MIPPPSPRMVSGAMTGATMALAMMERTDTVSWMLMSSGTVAMPARNGMAIASAMGRA